MHKILRKIIRIKKQELESTQDSNSFCHSELVSESSKEKKMLKRVQHDNYFMTIFKNTDLAVIAELKFASPFAGVLGSPKKLSQRVIQYEHAGVSAISVITEKHFFKGDVAYVQRVKRHTSLPVLQKDFVIDASQIYEAKKLGSDALLLITRIVDEKTLVRLVSLCLILGIEPIVEVHTKTDLTKAFKTHARIIAVNARDLDTFVIDVQKACKLLREIPNRYIKLGFSGIISKKEADLYKEAGAQGVLIGTALMQTKSVKHFLQEVRV